MRKLPTTASDEELLAILGDDTNLQNTPLKIDYRNDIIEFLSVYNIKPGDDRVKNTTLYNLYKLWSKTPVNQITFSRNLFELFPTIRYGTSHAVCINKTAIKLKEESWKILKPMDKRKYPGWKKHFELYLNKYSIKKGRFFVKSSVLYNLYDQWRFKVQKYIKRRPLGSIQFINFCKLYFNCKIINGSSWFGVDRSIQQHLTKEIINNMNTKKERKNVKEKNKKVRS